MTTETELCIVCEKAPIKEQRNQGRHPSVTCSSACANILSASDTLRGAKRRYMREHASDDAFNQFVYPKDYVI